MVSQSKLDIRKFNIKKLKPDRVVLLVGKRGSGKSILLEDILYYLSTDYDMGVGMSPTRETILSFQRFMPDSCIYEKFDADRLQDIIELVRELNHRDIYKRVFVLLDDCMFDKKAFDNKTIRDIFMNGRHLKFLFINCVQYIMDMKPDLRTQVDYMFTCREPSAQNRAKLYANFYGMFPTLEDFEIAMETCTNNYEVLVLDNTISSNKIEDVVFWYKANMGNPRFLLGNRDFWKLHYMFKKSRVLKPLGDTPIPALRKRKRAEEKVDKAQEKTEEDVQPAAKRGRGKKDHVQLVVEKRDEQGDIIQKNAPQPQPPITVPAIQVPSAPTNNNTVHPNHAVHSTNSTQQEFVLQPKSKSTIPEKKGMPPPQAPVFQGQSIAQVKNNLQGNAQSIQATQAQRQKLQENRHTMQGNNLQPRDTQMLNTFEKALSTFSKDKGEQQHPLYQQQPKQLFPGTTGFNGVNGFGGNTSNKFNGPNNQVYESAVDSWGKVSVETPSDVYAANYGAYDFGNTGAMQSGRPRIVSHWDSTSASKPSPSIGRPRTQPKQDPFNKPISFAIDAPIYGKDQRGVALSDTTVSSTWNI